MKSLVSAQTLLGAIGGVGPGTVGDPDTAVEPMPEEEVKALLLNVMLPDYPRLERLGKELAAADDVCPFSVPSHHVLHMMCVLQMMYALP